MASKKKNQINGVCTIGKTLSANGIGNPDTLAMMLRSGNGIMKDRRRPRGGARDKQNDIMSEWA